MVGFNGKSVQTRWNLSGAHFADRAREMEELEREMAGPGRIFLVSPRRYGKTCLLFNLLDRLREKGMAGAYIDLNAYPDLPGMAAAVTQTVTRSLETDMDKLLKVFCGLHRRPLRVPGRRRAMIWARLPSQDRELEKVSVKPFCSTNGRE